MRTFVCSCVCLSVCLSVCAQKTADFLVDFEISLTLDERFSFSPPNFFPIVQCICLFKNKVSKKKWNFFVRENKFPEIKPGRSFAQFHFWEQTNKKSCLERSVKTSRRFFTAAVTISVAKKKINIQRSSQVQKLYTGICWICMLVPWSSSSSSIGIYSI